MPFREWYQPNPALAPLERELQSIHASIHRLETRLMSALDDLTAQVAANKTVIDSAIALINGIAARITAAGTDPAALAALTSSLKDEDSQLAAAVASNTPPPPAAPTA